MNQHQEQYRNIQAQFAQSASVLQAIGDETRQHIMLSLFQLPCQAEGGARVGQITEQTHLSRPAVSHHLKILKEAGIVGMRREGTKNYYYLTNHNEELLRLQQLLRDVIQLTEALNKERGKDEKSRSYIDQYR